MMGQLTITALCGPPGAGKSTLAPQLRPDAVVVSVDRCRAAIPGSRGEHDQLVTGAAFGFAYDSVRRAIGRGRSVVFDSCAMTVQARASLLRFARSLGVPIDLVVLDVDRTTLLRQNRKRDNPLKVVSELRLDAMLRDFKASLPKLRREGFRSVRVLRPEQSPSVTYGKTIEKGLSSG
jgi:predicted kinase